MVVALVVAASVSIGAGIAMDPMGLFRDPVTPEPDPEPSNDELVKLGTPELVLNGDTATWNLDPLADKYEISVDGNLSYVENVVIGKKLADGQSLKIRAIGDGIRYSNSEWSNLVLYMGSGVHTDTYSVTWKCGNDILRVDENVAYGTMPTYGDADPQKEPTAQYTYSFVGWSPQIYPVTRSIVYQAQFSMSDRQYEVTFRSDDGTAVLDSTTVSYGSDAAYFGTVPQKRSTATASYEFETWVTTPGGLVTDNLKNITSDRTVFASFKEITRKTSVHIAVNDAEYGAVTTSVIENVPYGSQIDVSENTISLNGQTVIAQAADPTSEYECSFVGWLADGVVGEDTIVVACFERHHAEYTVTWMDGDAVLVTQSEVPYGTVPKYTGNVPEGKNGLIFSGWSPAPGPVHGNVTYNAQYADRTGKLTVFFYDDDGVTELGRSIVPSGGTAVFPNALPTKAETPEHTYAFDKWVESKHSEEEALLSNVTSNMSVFARYEAAVRQYSVTFLDDDGELLSKMEVEYGGTVSAPAGPGKEGSIFAGWSGGLDNITSDTVLWPRYVQYFQVEFIDYDGSVIDVQYVNWNQDAEAPDAPVRNGYRFNGWDTDFTHIVDELSVRALYAKTYNVNFLDHEGKLLKRDIVESGEDAVPPEPPVLDGFEFTGWDKPYTNVGSDADISATYALLKHSVRFVLPDGSTIGEPQFVEHGFSALAPDYPEVYAEGDGDSTVVYGFTRWDKPLSNITADTVINSVYDSPFTKPVLILEYGAERNGDAKLYIYKEQSTMLNGLQLSIGYSTETGLISIDSAVVNAASPLWVGDGEGNNNNQYVINNNIRAFTFAWSDANGKQFNWCSKVMTFSFSVDGTVVGEDTFRIEDASAIVSDSDGQNVRRSTVTVLYR